MKIWAKYISIITHPLLTIPIFVIAAMFTYEDFGKATTISLLIVGCIFIPTIVWLYKKFKSGTHTNFDVSDRKQRKSLFVFAIPLLTLVTIILYKTHQSKILCLSMLFALILLLMLQIANFYIKSSLHVAWHIYLSFLLVSINYELGIIAFLLTPLIAWSRVILGRHSIKEVFMGCFISLAVCMVMFYTENLS